MKGYADYEYYKNEYMGTAAAEEDFQRLSLKASRYIDLICCKPIDEVTECIRLSVCAVCDVLNELDNAINIKSESNDGYSVTYTADNSVHNKRLYDAARIYLDENLLYRGIV